VPPQRSIQAGDIATGVTIMRMDAGLDTGAMIEVVEVAIAPRETAGTLHDKLAGAGARSILSVLARLARDGALEATPQPATGATYAKKIERADAAIDWTNGAEAIDRQIRAFDPVPGAAAHFGGVGVKVWSADPVARAHGGVAGTVLAAGKDGVDVACGRGVLRIRELQPASGKRMSAAAFAAGHGVVPGTCFGPPLPA
jgi:methionyl-tRNA formyltransferase